MAVMSSELLGSRAEANPFYGSHAAADVPYTQKSKATRARTFKEAGWEGQESYFLGMGI